MIFLTVLFLIVTSTYLDYFLASVLLEPIKQEFGLSDTQLGLLSGACFAIAYTLTALPIAGWADRGDRRRVVVLALTLWSLATAACGLARSFPALVCARFCVGAAQPGSLPPAQSLLADYFPPQQRARAMTLLLNGASAVGWVCGVGVGSIIASRHGWRAAFLLAGISGLPLAVTARLLLDEPRHVVERFRPATSERFRDGIAHLARKRTFVAIILGVAVFSVFSYGTGMFVPSFMVRSLNASLSDIGLTWGGAIAAANVAGALLGGAIADGLGAHSPRWYAWLPAIAATVGMPVYWVAFSVRNVNAFILTQALAEFVLSVGIPVTSVALLAISGSFRRATASAAFFSVQMLVGITAGPSLAGGLSDWFFGIYRGESLRLALHGMCWFLVAAAGAFVWAALSMTRDLED